VADRTIEQWRDVLLLELAARQPTLGLRFAYYDGDHAIPRAPRVAREAYGRFLRQSRSNWVQLVVDSVAERLQVVGFRFGGDETGDADAWTIWQSNGLDADGELSQTDALTGGVSYVSVWPDESNPAGVSIAPEHPLQTIVAFDPRRRRRRVASAKVWVEPGSWMCWVATATESVTYTSPSGGIVDPAAAVVPGSWEVLDEGANPLGEVPVIELRPWPRTRPLLPGQIPGRSEMDGVLDIQDRINTTTFNRMVASEYASFRQRWATGLSLTNRRDPQTGEELVDPVTGLPIPVPPYDAAVDRLWTAEDAGVRFGEFGESELTGYIKASQGDIEQLAAITKTPPHYLLGQIVNASGDALKAAETGLVSKVSRRAAHLGEGWEDVMRLAFTAIGNPRAVDVGAEVIWRDFETRSEGERVDALTKMASLGVPRPVLWQRWGASPQEITRWQAMAADEALMAAVAATPVAGEPPPVPIPVSG
jgi:hypothetical protein